MSNAIRVLRTAVDSRPIPAATPIAAVTHMLAAVVSPRVSTSLFPIIMAPAPRNPTPAIRPCNTRLKSVLEAPACWGMRTKSAAPMATSMCVRTPALLPCRSRSYPNRPPRVAATRRRSTIRVTCVASGISENSDSTVFHISCHIPIALIITSCFLLLHLGTSRGRLTFEFSRRRWRSTARMVSPGVVRTHAPRHR
jgi:hypothetical protein